MKNPSSYARRDNRPPKPSVGDVCFRCGLSLVSKERYPDCSGCGHIHADDLAACSVGFDGSPMAVSSSMKTFSRNNGTGGHGLTEVLQ